MIDRSIERNTR